jgi:hypothetical protein
LGGVFDLAGVEGADAGDFEVGVDDGGGLSLGFGEDYVGELGGGWDGPDLFEAWGRHCAGGAGDGAGSIGVVREVKVARKWYWKMR